jgi:hypothetical protein
MAPSWLNFFCVYSFIGDDSLKFVSFSLFGVSTYFPLYHVCELFKM